MNRILKLLVLSITILSSSNTWSQEGRLSFGFGVESFRLITNRSGPFSFAPTKVKVNSFRLFDQFIAFQYILEQDRFRFIGGIGVGNYHLNVDLFSSYTKSLTYDPEFHQNRFYYTTSDITSNVKFYLIQGGLQLKLIEFQNGPKSLSFYAGLNAMYRARGTEYSGRQYHVAKAQIIEIYPATGQTIVTDTLLFISNRNDTKIEMDLAPSISPVATICYEKGLYEYRLECSYAVLARKYHFLTESNISEKPAVCFGLYLSKYFDDSKIDKFFSDYSL